MIQAVTDKIGEIVLVSIIGGVIGLDRTAAGQFMISQPIVAGPLIGWMLGDVKTGLIIGAVLELIWIMDIPVGTFVPADSTILTVWATAVAILGSNGRPPVSVIGFSILLTVLLVPITMTFDGLIRKWNSRLADFAQAAAGDNPGRKLSRAHLSGVIAFFLKSVITYLIFLPVGLALLFLFGQLPQKFQGSMSLFLSFLPLLGVASACRKLSIQAVDPFFLTGFMIAAVLSLLLHLNAVYIIVLVASAAWIGVIYREE